MVDYMANYTFESLSPVEFEAISRDLLQKHLKLTLETFTAGRDGGVDLRYSKLKDSDDIIVQCKRHISTFPKLNNHLVKKEFAKVKALKPKRYILFTAVGLTNANKKKLLADFHPYIKSTADIYGRDDINNLLGLYPDIEQQHYKLWLSSTEVMKRILSADIINKTLFEKDEIQQSVSLYVENESYPKALEIFSDNRFVIISGSPGIGKTTLARMMLYRLLANGDYDEFIYISRGVEEAYKLYEHEKKQLFFFDDFLGRNYFEKGFARNEESDLIRFIERISSSKNKGLILTTREYILRQAQSQYHSLNSDLISDHKYIIDLEKYTRLIKAKILYNHLHLYGLPNKYLLAFLDKQTYEYLIEHKNYSPRLIETILKEAPWKHTTPKEFPGVIKSYFDEPSRLWEEAYLNGISENARLLLKILFTLRTPIDISKLHAAFDASHRDAGERPDYHIFERTIKELENTFIRVAPSYVPGARKNVLSVDYKNPSIFDFLLRYFSDNRRNDLLVAIKNPVFVDQLVLRFNKDIGNYAVMLTPEISTQIASHIEAGFDKLPFCEDIGFEISTFSSMSGRLHAYPQVLFALADRLNLYEKKDVAKHLVENFKKFNESKENGEFYAQSDLIRIFSDDLSPDDLTRSIEKLADNITSPSEAEWFVSYYGSEKLNDAFEEWRDSHIAELDEKITNAILNEIEALEYEELETYEENLEHYHTMFGINMDIAKNAREQAMDQLRSSVEVESYEYDELPPSKSNEQSSRANEDAAIRDMFDSLRR